MIHKENGEKEKQETENRDAEEEWAKPHLNHLQNSSLWTWREESNLYCEKWKTSETNKIYEVTASCFSIRRTLGTFFPATTNSNWISLFEWIYSSFHSFALSSTQIEQMSWTNEILSQATTDINSKDKVRPSDFRRNKHPPNCEYNNFLIFALSLITSFNLFNMTWVFLL